MGDTVGPSIYTIGMNDHEIKYNILYLFHATDYSSNNQNPKHYFDLTMGLILIITSQPGKEQLHADYCKR